MANGKLILKGPEDKLGRKPVYIYLTHRGDDKLVATPERVNRNFVDKGKLEKDQLRVTSKAPYWKETNEALEKIEINILNALLQYKYKPKHSFTVADVHDSVVAICPWKEKDTTDGRWWKHTWDEWHTFCVEKIGRKYNTTRGYVSTRNEIEYWLTEIGKENISIDEFTGYLLNEWIVYLVVEEENDPDTIKKKINHVKGWGAYHNHPSINKSWEPIRNLVSVKKHKVFLTVEEVRKLHAYKPATKHMQNVKDMLFRFIATGVRWSDRDLTMVQRQGEFVLRRNLKNGNISAIPVNEYLLEVLAKPQIDMANQVFNRDVKILCENAGIDTLTVKISAPGGVVKEELVEKHTLVSSKIGRKTVVSLLKASGFTDAEVRRVIGNDVEIEAYEGTELNRMAAKSREIFKPVSAPSET